MDNNFLMGICPLFLANSLFKTPSSLRGDALLEIDGRFAYNFPAILNRFNFIIFLSSSWNSSIFFDAHLPQNGE